MPSFDILLAILVPIAIWAMVLAFMLALFLAVDDGLRRLKRMHQVPCYRCRYYTGSPYLKCPVHPLEACSEAAIGCKDHATTQRSAPLPPPTFKK
ncbi:MAG: hypothetical protein ACFCVD_11155 [Nodosilinea sp.]